MVAGADIGGDASLSRLFEIVSEMSDVMLPEAECDGRIVLAVLAVSLDTRERGRGMNSSVSENPTLVTRVGGLSACGKLSRLRVPSIAACWFASSPDVACCVG
jgi:hypothetical protein